jgi:hypothetical protein
MYVREKNMRRKDRMMSSRSKREYLEAIYLRYKRASRTQKRIIPEISLLHLFPSLVNNAQLGLLGMRSIPQ